MLHYIHDTALTKYRKKEVLIEAPEQLDLASSQQVIKLIAEAMAVD